MAIEQVAQGSEHRAAGVQEAFGHYSQTDLHFGQCCVEPGVGLHDPCPFQFKMFCFIQETCSKNLLTC